MKRTIYAAAAGLAVLVAGCAQFKNPDMGEPEVDHVTSSPVSDVIGCLMDSAKKHDSPVKTSPIPQGSMLDFGDSNIVKVRTNNGQTTYRFYPGKRHVSTLWIEGASKTCAP